VTRLRIGTRRSRLALAQAGEVAARLAAFGVETELLPMTTSGDRGASPDRSPFGLKGLFVDAIEDALRSGRIDLAVHSAKDLPSEDPPGLTVAAVPERSDPFDVLVTREPWLRDGGVVGTSSLRRRAQFLRSRPGVRVEELRGNVDTRLRRLNEGALDGVLLAAAGLARLGVRPANARPLPIEDMVPAPGQGALAIQTRADDDATLAILARLEHARSRAAFDAERRLTSLLGGGCALPLGAYAEQRDEGTRLLAVVVRPDGEDLVWAQAEAGTPEEVAGQVAETLRRGGADAILAAVRGEA
jgi:hydroxymethylbilane synthase